MLTNREKLTAQAQKFIEKGQYDKAIREYLKIVADDEKDVRTWLKIGDLHVKLGQRPEAAQTYQRVAQFYSDQGFYLKAVAVYKQIVKIDPRLLEVNTALAELYRQLGLTQDAISQYESVAGAFLREGRTREAVAAHRAILELDPDNVAQRIKLAELYSKQEMIAEAVVEFGRTADQLKAMGRTEDYLKVAERLLFHDPNNRPVSKELAQRYLERGDARRALTKLQSTFKHNPRDLETLELLGQAFLLLGQEQKCVSVLREMARLATEVGRHQDAAQYQQRIQIIHPASQASPDGTVQHEVPISPSSALAEAALSPPDSPVRPVRLAWPTLPVPPPSPSPSSADTAQAVTRPPSTASEAARAAAAAPVHAETREEELARIVTEADVFVKYGLYQKAVEHLKRVLEQQPRLREVRERLYELFEQTNQPQEAIAQLWELVDHATAQEEAARYLGEVLRIDPDNKAAVLRWRQIRAGGSSERLPKIPSDSSVPALTAAPAPAAESASAPGLGSLAPPPPPARGEGPLREALLEVDFFLQQGLYTEARLRLQELQERHPGHALVQLRQRRLVTEGGERTASARPTPPPTAEGPRSVYEMTRQGLRERGGVRSSDASACYDLGVAYRDMGLFADAINEFRKALHSSRLEGQSRLMIGVCLLDQERPTDALAELHRALAVAGVPQRQVAEAHYYLGRAYERLGAGGEAMASYEQALRMDNGLRDTRERLAALAGAGVKK